MKKHVFTKIYLLLFASMLLGMTIDLIQNLPQ